MGRKLDLLWACSLLVIGVGTLILAGSRLAGLALPDALVRVIGVLDLLALPVLAYTTVRKAKK